MARSTLLKRSLKALTLAAVGATLGLAPSAAQAQEVPGLEVDYDATGWSHIATTDSDLWIKPTTLSITLDPFTSAIEGHMPLLPADTKFHVIGFLPIKAQVNFEEAAPVTGRLVAEDTYTRVESQASYYIRLSDVLIGGLPAFAGNNCRTKEPVVIPANTAPGDQFNIITGGKLVGTYSIGKFQNCNLNTGIINLLVPGGGNTVDLDVSNGRLG